MNAPIEAELDKARRDSLRRVANHLRAIADSSKALIDARWTLQAETAGDVECRPKYAEVKLTGRCRATLTVEWDEADPDARKPDERPKVTVEHLGRRNEFHLTEVDVEIVPKKLGVPMSGLELRIVGNLEEREG